MMSRRRFSTAAESVDVVAGETTRLNEYYEGDQRLEQLGLAIPPELQPLLGVPELAAGDGGWGVSSGSM
jgi:hypothetical protein